MGKAQYKKSQEQKPNRTGIPTQMKSKFERKSGLSFDDVRVHYNSKKPAQLQALAYTQGSEVHIAPGHEKHLPHELGHVVQQKMGLVKPTQTINGMKVNTDRTMESNADMIAQMRADEPIAQLLEESYEEEDELV